MSKHKKNRLNTAKIRDLTIHVVWTPVIAGEMPETYTFATAAEYQAWRDGIGEPMGHWCSNHNYYLVPADFVVTEEFARNPENIE